VSADVELAAAKARQSVVRVEGSACQEISSGSGFVVAPGFVATNAHVLAGVATPIVVSSSGKFRAVPVWFNDRLDFAVLRVEGLEAPVLPLAGDAPDPGQTGAILGYPGGGPLKVDPGVMKARYQAVGRDIYGESLVTREIYQMQATIHPGNSGGPFVLPNGSVAGVMFGASPEQPTISYAITSMEVAGELRQAVADNTEAATGKCL
jgi:S1-C subfamily serine protease